MNSVDLTSPAGRPVSPAVTAYVAQFNQYSRKTAEAIIGMAETIFSAKKSLDADPLMFDNTPIEFNQFCRAIGYDPDGSSIRKLIKIGEMADMLKRHTEQLPNTWTTLYTLTRLGSETMERLIDQQRIVATMTAKEAMALQESEAGKVSSKQKGRTQQARQATTNLPWNAGYALAVRFPTTPTAENVAKIEAAIRRILSAQQPDAQVTRNAELDKMMSDELDALAIAA